MTKEELLQDWLPRLMGALQEVRNNENAAAQETIYELYVEMSQQTLAEKMSTFSEITLEDQMSAMAIELQSAQKRVAEIENSICQRAFVAKQEQGEPMEYWNAVEGWVKLDEVREHFDSVNCATIYKNGGEGRVPLYTTPQQRTWVGLTDRDIEAVWGEDVSLMYSGHYDAIREIEARLKQKNAK